MMNQKPQLDLARAKVRDIMTSRVTCVGNDDTIHRALQIMSEENLAALPVVNAASVCLGILSRSDLADLFVELDESVDAINASPLNFGGDYPDGFRTLVREFMNPEVLTIGPDDSVIEAARSIARHGIHHLPVVRDDGTLVGILSTLDIARLVGQSA